MRRSSALAALAGLMLAACAPTCDQTCRKLAKCADDDSTVTRVECEETCVDLLNAHDEAEDDARKELFASHRRCVTSATCEELDDGVCYDDYEALYAF